MKQQTLAGFANYSKTTRRAKFLTDMDRVVPWAELVAVVEPPYPKVSPEGGRPPVPLERMLRIYFLQLWFDLSDPAVEEALYSAPSSTKNKDQERDPEMHQTAKGKQWYFGMRAPVGVDSKTKLIHTILASAANIPDTMALPHLLHGREMRVYGDQRYQGQTDVIREVAPNARDFTNRKYRFPSGRVDEIVKAKNRTKSKVRAKVEHVIGVIKRVFGFQKTRYRGLAKNLHRLEVMAALTNVFMQRRRLLAR
jgi:IS5 family transposase